MLQAAQLPEALERVETDRLTIAEQCIDRQERTELFEGRQLNLATGRVLLHALDGDGLPKCGHDRGQLTPIARAWSAEYLPHLPRCHGCVAAHRGDLHEEHHAPASSALAESATGVDIRTAHGTESEDSAAAALTDVLATYDLRRWMFTDLVIIDESIRGGFSHPLTISPPRLTRRPAMALTTFIHEQLHCIDGPGSDSATAEARERWPDPPSPPAGCRNAQSTWLHMSVCALEYQSLSEILGQAAAEAELAEHVHYSWLYEHILADPAWFADYLQRHGLQVPDRPPVPRRYIGEEWWTTIAR
jgi:hypothetical protein